MPALIIFARVDLGSGFQAGDVLAILDPATQSPGMREIGNPNFGFLHVPDATREELSHLLETKKDPRGVILNPDEATALRRLRVREVQIHEAALGAPDLSYRPITDSRRAQRTKAQLAAAERTVLVRAPGPARRKS